MKTTVRSIRYAVAFSVAISSFTAFAAHLSVAEELGWKPGKSANGECNICDGYYAQPLAIADVENPPSYKTATITVTAKGPVIFRADGASVLQDDVKVVQVGRLAHADKAILYHNKKTGKITDIKLIGHVRVQEKGRLLIGDSADYNIAENTLTINKAIYHIAGKHQLLTVSTPFDAWGTATYLHRDAQGVIQLKNATYSTCPPKDPSWVLSASKLVLNHNTQKGYARNVVIRFKKIPIFYAPYYSFPLNAERKSGLLAPMAGYENGTGQRGFYFALPYYWNIAPNYDFLFTPTWYSERGLQYNGLFRYLTTNSDGFLYASILPNDRQFASFRQNTLNTVVDNSSAAAAPYITQLQNDSNDRIFINFDNNMHFTKTWSGKLYARYIGDAYYAEDFSSEYLSQNSNQIPSLAELHYDGSHWDDRFILQSYQTLHPLNQFTQPAQNQYTRLPELDFNAVYPQFLDHLNFDLSAQAVNFEYASAFAPYTYQMPIGDRFHIAPSISRPFDWSSFYITPTLTADSTSYDSQLAATASNLPRSNFDLNRTLPIFDIDTGMYFNRYIEVGGKHYVQTLEPRIFYLYTPYLNQDNYPNFDTQILPFSITNLYSLNEFTGFDRVQNANQASIGLTSNILNAANARDILTAQLGFIDYFKTPDVCLTQTCQPTTESISPIAGALTWYPSRLWSVTSQVAWDSEIDQINNAQLGAEYQFRQHHILLLNYQFTHSNPDIPFGAPGYNNDTSLVTAGLVWPLTMRWHLFGYSYYDLTLKHPQSQYLGLSYNTCCWALRFIVSQDYNGTTNINGSQQFQSEYNTTYFVEFLLKGLGSVGNNSAEELLRNTLPMYQDDFSNRGHYGYSSMV